MKHRIKLINMQQFSVENIGLYTVQLNHHCSSIWRIILCAWMLSLCRRTNNHPFLPSLLHAAANTTNDASNAKPQRNQGPDNDCNQYPNGEFDSLSQSRPTYTFPIVSFQMLATFRYGQIGLCLTLVDTALVHCSAVGDCWPTAACVADLVIVVDGFHR